jgi:cytochrome c oxidase cbb3-type subunit 1
MMASSPTLRFTFVGTIFFSIAAGLSVLSALRSVDSYTHFTAWTYGQVHLMTVGFFSMVMFGAIYYITPRLVGCEWLSRTFIKLHFFGTAYGAGTIIGLFLFGGLATGFALNEATGGEMDFYNVNGIGNAYMPVKTFGYFLFGLAQITFAFHFLLMRFRIGQPAGEPTLFETPGEAH